MLYFISGKKSVTKDEYESLGLSHLAGTSPSYREVIGTGPDGGKGVILHPTVSGETAPKIEYKPDRQTWVKCKRFWVGWENGEKPGPNELRREKLCTGYPVELNDGNEWVVVIAKIFSTTGEDATHLPEYFGLDKDGGMITKVIERYSQVVEDAKRFWDVSVNSAKGGGWDEAVPMAARALGVNYRISTAECLALNLFTHDNVNEVLTALIDGYSYQLNRLQELEAAQKKTGVEE